MPKQHTLDTKDRFIELRAKGYPFSEIATQLQVSKPTLIEWAKELQNDIENRKAMEIEALQEKYYASWKQRLEFVGEEFGRIKEELASRDYADMSTKELYEIALKFQQQLGSLERKSAFKVETDLDDRLRQNLKNYMTVDV